MLKYLSQNYYICDERRTFEDGLIDSIDDIRPMPINFSIDTSDDEYWQGHIIVVGSKNTRNLILRSRHYASSNLVPIVLIVNKNDFLRDDWKIYPYSHRYIFCLETL